ncbi:Ankyrin repeat-containing protein [Glarea lozoyensis ATCC 20868]|uniref:Ankyrin repeat-containing protein n=1 Tax=Glarea lozoyensis (strain ATCC 20868 / MF5171) TaxID=1116229 RepID=S3CWM2_GLAL2|nr:Ankyrin repeat-containing protein [Glarea lozoyensis ATCC 20868]EPE24221.1 Ankyrin repeat-containing protein [Glarea lozoyensis ATCC 20868]
MDPFSALANGVALAESLKKFYRFVHDAKNASAERTEVQARLNSVQASVQSTMKLLEDSLPKLQGSETPNWIKDLEMKNSPIEGLRSLMDKVIKVLETKKGGLHRLWKDLKWHSEKKHLEEDFNAMDNFCASIQRIIQNAIKDDTSIIKEGTKAIKEDTEDTKERLKRIEDKTDADRNEKRLKKAQKERKEIEEWLSTLNFQARQHEILRGAADTGTWFLDLPAFKIWKEGRLDILQCYGAMGTGKTVLSSIVVEHLVRTMPDIPTLVLYLEETPKESHDPDNLFGSLVKQLIQLRGPADPIPNKIHEAWEKASKIDVPPTPEALEESFSRLVEEKDRVQIVISGLDKATEESRLFVLKSLQKKAGVKLLISARRDVASTDNQINCSVESCKNKALDVYYTCKPCLNENKNNRFDICQDCHRKDVSCPVDEDHEVSLPKKLEVVITAPDEDLEKYIRQKIEEKMPRTDNDMDPDMESSEAEAEELGKVCAQNPGLMDHIVLSIIRNSHEKFLLAKLYTKSLIRKCSKKDIDDAIEEMDNNNYDIAELIDHLFENELNQRLASLYAEEIQIVKKTFSIIFHAKRDLNFRELQHALAVIPGMKAHDGQRLVAKNKILKLTKGFITIGQDTDQIVRFDDRVLRNYFEKKRETWFPNGGVEMANICLDYLSIDAFSRPCPPKEFAEKEKKHDFLAYAVENWGHHVRLAAKEVGAKAAQFLQDYQRIQAYIQAAWETNVHKNEKWDVRKRIHALHICAWFDLWEIIPLLDMPLDIDVQEGTYGQTPLIYACRRGNMIVARRLLELGASIDIDKKGDRSAMLEAISRKNFAIVKLLLEPNHKNTAKVNTRSSKKADRPPLMVAIKAGCEDIALALLSHPDIDVNIKDKYGYTALSLASFEKQKRVVDTLVSSRFSGLIDLNAREITAGRSALILAAKKNHAEILKTLLNAGADPDLRDLRKGTAIFRSIEGRALESFKLLLSYQVDTKLKDERGRTLMHHAAEHNRVEMIELLSCASGPSMDVNAKDDLLMTPLHRACALDNFEAAERLLDLGADFTSVDSFQRTPFIVAWQYRSEEVMQLIEDNAAGRNTNTIIDINVEDLPVWSLVRSRSLDLLIQAEKGREAEFSFREPGTGKTCFHLAITGDNTGNFDQDDIACRIIEILLNSCANDLLDATDDDKQTPLHLASIRGYVKCVELLVKHHAKLDEVDRFGKTAIYSSFVNGNLVTTVTLVEAGAKVSEGGGVSLQKILFAAIDFQSVIAVQKLFEAGADVLAQDENGLTPKKKAIQTGNDEILHLISTSRSLYIKEVPSRKVTELQNDVAELRESTADELILMPSPPTDLKTIPFHGFRASAVELDWNTEEDMESQEDRRELVPVLC